MIWIDIYIYKVAVLKLSDVSVLLPIPSSWGVDGDDSFNTSNYENRTSIRPIYRVGIVQSHNVSRTSNKGCEWDLKKKNVPVRTEGRWEIYYVIIITHLSSELVNRRTSRNGRLTTGKEDRGFMSIVVDWNLDVVVRKFGINAKAEGACKVGFDRHSLFSKPSAFFFFPILHLY